jgi:hypothetical protein
VDESVSATDMPPLSLTLPDLASATCAGGSLPEIEVDKGGGDSQQTETLPVHGTVQEEEMTVLFPNHAEDEMEQLVDEVFRKKMKKKGVMDSGHDKGKTLIGPPRNSIKILIHTIYDGELCVVDGGLVFQPDMQIIMDAFGQGGEDKGKEKVKEKGPDAPVPLTISQDPIIEINEVPKTDGANDAPVEDNATPSPAKALGTDKPVVYQPFRQPTLFVPSSLALPVDQGTVTGASKLAYLFGAPPPLGPFTFGKPPGNISSFGASKYSPAPSLIHPPESTTSPFSMLRPASGTAQLSLKFTPSIPILTSTEGFKSGLSSMPQSTNSPVAANMLTPQTSSYVASNGISTQGSPALALTQAPSNPFARDMSPGEYASIASLHRVLKSASSKSFAITHPNIPIADTVGNQHLARARLENGSRITTSDPLMESIIRIEGAEQFPMVANRRSSLVDIIPPTVKKRMLPKEVAQLSKVQERIDVAQDANSVSLFTHIPPSVILTNTELKAIRNVQSQIYNKQHGLTPTKRQKLNDKGKGKWKHDDKTKSTLETLGTTVP